MFNLFERTFAYAKHLSNILIKSKLFWLGILARFAGIFFFSSDFTDNYFYLFINNFLSNGFSSYNHISHTFPEAFPYPALYALLVSIPQFPLKLLGLLNETTFSIVLKLLYLFFDLSILYVLCKWINSRQRKVLLYYWLSPAVIYIAYFLGQMDVVPIALLFISLLFIFKNENKKSLLFFLSALCTKTSTFLVFPLYIIFYFRKCNSFKRTIIFLSSLLIGFTLLNSIGFIYPGYFDVVFLNKTQGKLLNFSLSFGSNFLFYVIPTLLGVLYWTFSRYFILHRDTLLTYLGFVFSVILVFIPPSPGWLFWVIPFLAFFASIKNNRQGIYLLVLLQLSFLAFSLLNKESPDIYLRLLNLKINQNLDSDFFNNLLFTTQSMFLLLNSLWLFKAGLSTMSILPFKYRPFVLGIGGDSGSGKSTFSNQCTLIRGKDESLIIRGDDMHRWARGNENWKKFTHLDPKANFLMDDARQLTALKKGHSIKRRHYDHDTGKFTKPEKIFPKSLVIYEGLHPFLLETSRNCYDFKVFMKPDDTLRKNWKIERDTKKRGYSQKKILDQLNFRENDSQKYIRSQEKFADLAIEVFEEDGIEGVRFYLQNKITIDQLDTFLKESGTVKTSNLEYLGSDRQLLEVKGMDRFNPSTENILQILPELDVYGMSFWKFPEGMNGIIQITTYYCIFRTIEFDIARREHI